jgi:hypothetical protein
MSRVGGARVVTGGVPRERLVLLLARGPARFDGYGEPAARVWTQKTLRPFAPRTTIAPRADGALGPSLFSVSSVRRAAGFDFP